MPIVNRPYYKNDVSLDFVSWKNATTKEKVRAAYFRAASAVAVVALALSYGDDMVGHTDIQIPEAEQVTALRSSAAKNYAAASLTEQFATNFIQPKYMETADNDREGSGILGKFTDPHLTARLSVGRACLKGSAYDTTPYKGDASAVAALSVTSENSIAVHAAGSDAAALVFTISEAGNFIPDAKTEKTLTAYDCRYLGVVPVREAYTDESYDYDWQYVSPLSVS